MTATCSQVAPLKVNEDIEFLIPSPSMYILQKTLCRGERRSFKKNKDLAYIFDAVTIFRNSWPQMGQVANEVAKSAGNYKKWIARACRELKRLFASEQSEGPSAVQTVYTGAVGSSTPLSTLAIARVMNQFLDQSGFAKM